MNSSRSKVRTGTHEQQKVKGEGWNPWTAVGQRQGLEHKMNNRSKLEVWTCVPHNLLQVKSREWKIWQTVIYLFYIIYLRGTVCINQHGHCIRHINAPDLVKKRLKVLVIKGRGSNSSPSKLKGRGKFMLITTNSRSEIWSKLTNWSKLGVQTYDQHYQG